MGRTLLKIYLILFAVIILTGGQVFAQATFGAEFTFTNSAITGAQTQGNIVNNPESESHRDRMAEAALRTCGNCRLIKEENAYGVDVYKIMYPDGFYFVIATDPAVVEVQTKPMTTSEIKQNEARMRRDLFGAATSVGMAASPRGTGGGHIHIGYLSSTGGDLLLMRNIIVDFANHPELANGILANDHWNSPPIQALPQESQFAFKKIIDDFDAGRIRDIQTFASRIENEVYTWHRAGWNPPSKYQGFNVSRLANLEWNPSERTFEIRSIRPQQSIEQYEALTNLLEGRIEYLRSRRSPIALELRPRESVPQEYERFSKYTSEAGLDFAAFRQTMGLGGDARRVQIHAPLLLCFRLLRGA